MLDRNITLKVLCARFGTSCGTQDLMNAAEDYGPFMHVPIRNGQWWVLPLPSRYIQDRAH